MTARDAAKQLMLNQTIGAAIREARLARGVTQEELARAFGIDRVTVARYERGTRTISAPALLQMLSFLGREIQLDGGQPSSGERLPTRVKALDPTVHRIVQLLQKRPELIETVTDLFETLDVWPATGPDEIAP